VDTRDPGVYPALMRAASRVTVAAGDNKSQPLTVSVVR
jgi:hypothetical protein